MSIDDELKKIEVILDNYEPGIKYEEALYVTLISPGDFQPFPILMVFPHNRTVMQLPIPLGVEKLGDYTILVNLLKERGYKISRTT